MKVLLLILLSVGGSIVHAKGTNIECIAWPNGYNVHSHIPGYGKGASVSEAQQAAVQRCLSNNSWAGGCTAKCYTASNSAENKSSMILSAYLATTPNTNIVKAMYTSEKVNQQISYKITEIDVTALKAVNVDLTCAEKVAQKIDEKDRKSKLPQLVAEGSTLSVDEVTDANEAGLKTLNVTVNEADYMDGYTVWSVTVKGTDAQCEVIDVVLVDSAL